LANKPTAGLDLELQQRIQARLVTEAEAGTAILLVSEDFDELCLVCHRIVVMRDSRIVAIFSSSEITQEAIIRYMVTNADYGVR
jgi:ribose transport system ATP-binding protein